MKQWFRMKFNEDLSDIRQESRGYYKHYVYNFVMKFFLEEKIAGKNILDFGCGPGYYSAILAQRGANVYGIDLSKYLIGKARKHKSRLGLENVSFINADLIDCHSRWERGSFDYVVAIDTIVSFDHNSKKHNHEKAVAAFSCISRLLKDDGRFFIMEAHPAFGRVSQEITSDTGERFGIMPYGYKIKYKQKDDPHHWFTLDEMTRATSQSGMAVLRILEPDPAIALKRENPGQYSFHLKYPGMIVYEICKLHPSRGHRDGVS